MEKVKRKKIVPFKEKQEVIINLEKGFETEESILAKYQILPQTLRQWRFQVLQPVPGHRSRLRITEAEKRKAVREVRSGRITVAEAVIKYGCRYPSTIRGWIKQFSDDISDIAPLIMAESEKDPTRPGRAEKAL